MKSKLLGQVCNDWCHSLSPIESNILGLQERIAYLTKEIAKLTQQGTSQAKFYIRKDVSKKTGEIIETYYLLHPMRNGKRVKEYVGRDAYEIRKAQDRMDRYIVRAKLIHTLTQLETKLDKTLSLLDEVYSISSVDRLF
jgi:hypothetical protein